METVRLSALLGDKTSIPFKIKEQKRNSYTGLFVALAFILKDNDLKYIYSWEEVLHDPKGSQ